jgi:hypothetical protein
MFIRLMHFNPCTRVVKLILVETHMGYLKGICLRGNNKVVIIIFHVYDKCLFLMLELY